ncbi:MAG TPA: hypothetical protein VHG69_06755, partial [Thermoleophilaceae bacterium]|nr:hypothetical protein [Thermoleophilaceae bacterium]
GHEDDPEDGSDGEVFGFPERDVRFSDLCVDGAPHDDGDGSDPNSNLCTDPLLVGPVGDEDVDQTSSSPTIDAGLNELVPDDLGEDYAGDPRITDGNRDGTATVDMGADEFPGPIPAATPTPTQPAAGCVNAVGRVRGRSLGPARLGRTRAAQREIFRGARLRSRPGMDKYCASPNGLFRLGYPTGRILSRVGRGLRRAVSNRVVLILTTSRGTTLSGVRPGVTRSSEVPRRLRRTRRRVGKNTWFVTRTRNNVLLLIKVQRGLVREIGIGDSRLARGDGRQLKRYLKTWQALF